MPTPILTVVARLRQDVAQRLTPDAIRLACREARYTWRNRILDPVATIGLFLLQVLHGNTACQHVVHFGVWTFSAVAYCKARKRLPLRVLQILLERLADTMRSATASGSKWLGHRVWIEDGSSFSMPDVPALQDHFGQPTGQRPGCGFPVAKWVALFDLTTGMLSRVTVSPLRAHDMAKAAEIASDVAAGDVVLGDRGFCSYAHMTLLSMRCIHAVFRLHQKQIVDFTPGREVAAKRCGQANPEGRPHSLWVKTNGPWDQIVTWFKPKYKPTWMTVKQYALLPSELTVRELRYRVSQPGFRVKEITLVTTLLEADVYPAPEVAALYRRRWQVELNFRHMKITMKMDVLKCKTVDGVLKELTIYAIAYNLIRSVMVESARIQGMTVDRLGFVDALRWLLGPGPVGDVSRIMINPGRPDRVEPRVRKRRPKQFPVMKEPRTVLRNRLTTKEVAA